MLKLLEFIIFILLALVIYSCSASTDTRYAKDTEKEKSKTKEEATVAEDNFDIIQFRTKIKIPEADRKIKDKPDLWFDYPDTVSAKQTSNKTVVDTMQGYRVQVISTDDLEEANGIRSQIYFKTNEKAVYVIFEPPFYVVRVGDCKNINDAKALSFKLSQLGFAGTKVVNDVINIYK
jgi:hypothetical protein